MKTPRIASALMLTTIATIATLLSTPASNIVAKPLPVNANALYRPITIPAPMLMPHNHHTASPPRRGHMRTTLHAPNQPFTPAHTAFNTTQPASPSTNVVIAGMRFRPALMHIKTGDQVTWINHEPVVHIISSPNNGLLASDPLVYGSVFKHTFNERGIYNYYCTLNLAMMGIVIVD